MTKKTGIYNGEKTTSSINGVGKIGYLYAKQSNWTTFTHHTQEQTHNGLKTYM